MVRTPASHVGNAGSTPAGITKYHSGFRRLLHGNLSGRSVSRIQVERGSARILDTCGPQDCCHVCPAASQSRARCALVRRRRKHLDVSDCVLDRHRDLLRVRCRGGGEHFLRAIVVTVRIHRTWLQAATVSTSGDDDIRRAASHSLALAGRRTWIVKVNRAWGIQALCPQRSISAPGIPAPAVVGWPRCRLGKFGRAAAQSAGPAAGFRLGLPQHRPEIGPPAPAQDTNFAALPCAGAQDPGTSTACAEMPTIPR